MSVALLAQAMAALAALAFFFWMHTVNVALRRAHEKADRALEESYDLLTLLMRRELLTATGQDRERLLAALERRTGEMPPPKAKA